jgi:CxxC motif-containing protein (DUF1111 family)
MAVHRMSRGRLAPLQIFALGVFAFPLSAALFAGEPEQKLSIVESIGHDLFIHIWTVQDPLAGGGDGLGPMFNERSCAACHSQGGVGGSGGVDKNSFALSVERRGGGPLDARDDKKLLARAGRILPELASHPGGAPLHSHSIQRGYEGWRRQRINWADQANSLAVAPKSLRPEEMPAELQRKFEFIQANRPEPFEEQTFALQVQGVVDAQRKPRDLKIVLSEANTPPLFGLGLIDSIPDEAILAEAKFQASKAAVPAANLAGARIGGNVEPPVKGRAGGVADGRIGRFGWKAQHATLEEFALTACAVEIGLQVAGHSQTPDPRHATTSKSLANDMNEGQCQALIAYLRRLPAPRETSLTTSNELVRAGQAVFEAVGCADCHVRRLGHVSGLYSDLLLHDMGSTLRGQGHYQVGMLAHVPVVKAAAPEPASGGEWRTPPLWGVADSAPYLHDGRAATLDEAILKHDGEGARSSRLYRESTDDERAALIKFLHSLVGPDLADPALAQNTLVAEETLKAGARPKSTRATRKAS